eukprot:g6717.t1
MPSLVTLTRSAEKWLPAIQRAKSSTQMYCYVHNERCIKVGRTSFSVEQVAQNVESVVQQMMKRKSDRGWDGILQLFLCTGESLRLPIYQTFPDAPIIEIQETTEPMLEEKQENKSFKRKRKPTRSTLALKKALVEVLTSMKKDA